ncbi:BtrH N-terminal domain-containing protein [Pseudoalteromonas luteoviolacea]|uniref:Butirosin biosynthesis protein H N-terminal domain-containing protein n=1 Tax=Pseudoalteromonas luteoviolacea NCIMB 1942 TaxID=1365253 RepID=A0A167HS76_9GAMM|nr:hypothetical protein [Pseudoalteromonas luteoviolacea]KZN58468.1 hypothetical protein N482_21900 [Pseudoalteromonas luteoviolacea NCIMB 1942]
MKLTEGQGVTDKGAIGMGVANTIQAWQSCLPDCLFMAIELEAREKFAIPDMARLFGEHSYYFDCKQKKGLDVLFGRYEDSQYYVLEDDTLSGYLGDKLLALYGLKVIALSFSKQETLDHYLATQLAKNQRVICEFSAKHVPYRIEDYHKHYGYHILTFKACDKDSGSFMVDDALKQDVYISALDYQLSFQNVLAHEGCVRVYQLEQVGPSSPLTLEWALKQVEQNIAGLSSDQAHVGASAISESLEYISCLQTMERPYVVPGLWVFSLQRASTFDWLMALQKDFPDPKLKHICSPMTDALPHLAKNWKEVEVLMRLSCRSKSVTGSQIYQRIVHLCETELALIPVWFELRDWLYSQRYPS